LVRSSDDLAFQGSAGTLFRSEVGPDGNGDVDVKSTISLPTPRPHYVETKVWNRTSQVPPACSYNLKPGQKEGERVSCAVAAVPPSSSTSPSPSR